MTTSPHTPSRYQRAIYTAVDDAITSLRTGHPFRHIVVDATAGAGKTATIVECCRRMPDVRTVVVAFGKRNADELQAKLPSSARASTLHSLGNAAWVETLGGRNYAPDVAVEGHSRPGKLTRIIGAEVDAGRIPKWFRYKVAKLVDLARMHGIVPGSYRKGALRGGVGVRQGVGGEGALDDVLGALGAVRGAGGDAAAVATAAAAAANPFTPGDVAVNDVLPLHGLVDDTDAVWEGLMQHYDIYVNGINPSQLIRWSRDVLRKAIRYGHRVVDYTDMLYLPTLAAGSSWRLDGEVLFVDELQDLDHLQRQMVLHLISGGTSRQPATTAQQQPRCVFVGVGDPQQAIMSFRGADADSMSKIIAATGAQQLPLSICYRCPTSHIALAQTLVPTIEARDGAGVGLLERYDEEGQLACIRTHLHGFDCVCVQDHARLSATPLRPRAFQPGDLVICRAKAPLVKAAYYLLKNHVPAHILGKDIGRGLLAFVDAMRAASVTDLLKKVDAYTNKVVARACELDDDAAVEEASDRRDVIIAVADGLPDSDDIDDLKSRLEGLFGDGDNRESVVTLSTIHRAKGAEADRVWWLDYHKPDLSTPFKHERQRREAACLRFVASTRSRRELRLIRSESLK